MADIKLKDASGTDQEYIGVNSVSFRSTTEGETVTFIAQQQVDWNQNDETAVDYIKNKPQDLATESYVQEQIDAIGVQEGIATEAYVQEQIAAIEIPDTQVQSDWDQTDSVAKSFIKNRPFGLLPDILTEQELTFVLADDAPAIRTGSITVEQPIVIGETYKVAWDGAMYELVTKDMKDISTGSLGVTIDSMPYLGNSNISGLIFGLTDWGEDTGEPFLINFSASNNNTVTINTTDLVNTTHTVSISPTNKIKKLSAEWLPDGLATEDFVKEQIAAIEIPEGGGSSGGSVSTEKVIYAEDTWDTFYSDSYFTYIFVQAFGESVPAFPLELGDECVVVWDGVEYEVTVGDSSNILADTLFVGNGSQFGLLGNGEPFAIAWDSTGVTFVAWTDTETTEHTVRIYQKAPLTVSWENVTDKPFGEEIVTVFEGTFQDTLVDNDGDGVNDAWANEMIIKDTSEATLVIGETYTVIFEGVEYELKCLNLNGLPFIGNEGLVTGTPDETPFLIIRDPYGVMDLGQCWGLSLIEPSTDLTISGAYDVKITGTVIKHLDNKYLDILEGEEKPETEIFAEQTVEGFAKDGETYFTSMAASTIGFTTGATYNVVWDDVEYEFVAEITDVVSIGDVENYDPFWMVGTTEGLVIFTSDMTATSHKIRIYQPATTETIKEKYIPIIAEEKLPILEGFEDKEIEIYPEDTWSTQPSDEFGFVCGQAFGEELPVFPLTIGDECIVVWDGEEYKVTVGDLSFLMPNAIFVGNGTALELPGNNEPFLIGWDSTGVTFVALTDTEPTEHTVRIYQKIEGDYKIKESYIPDSVKLPAATAEDNNKFLRIVDGIPTWVSLTDVSTEGA